MAKITKITLSYLRANLPDILNRAMYLNESFDVTKHGKEAFKIRPPNVEGARNDKKKR